MPLKEGCRTWRGGWYKKKVTYTLENAEVAKVSLNSDYGNYYRIYRCDDCVGYHVGKGAKPVDPDYIAVFAHKIAAGLRGKDTGLVRTTRKAPPKDRL